VSFVFLFIAVDCKLIIGKKVYQSWPVSVEREPPPKKKKERKKSWINQYETDREIIAQLATKHEFYL